MKNYNILVNINLINTRLTTTGNCEHISKANAQNIGNKISSI